MPRGGSKPGERRGGRQKGTPNKVTKSLKEAILAAGEAVGRDGKGNGGMVGYLKGLAVDQPVAFAGLLGKVLPTQITGEGGGPVEIAASLREARESRRN